jgi:hypothetical protein
LPKASIDYALVRGTHLSIRINLAEDTFVDIYFNEETQRIDLALIHEEDRIYGVDNLGGWHCHPFRAPEQHLFCPEPSIEKVFSEMQRITALLGEKEC